MNNIELERILKSLVGDSEYRLTYNEKGTYNISDAYNSLYYRDRKEVIWLSIIDTDKVDESQIYDIARSVPPNIQRMQQEQSGTYVYTILISQYGIKESIIEQIKQMQMDLISNQKAPRCFSINISQNKIDKLFTRKVTAKTIEPDLENAIKNVTENKYEDITIQDLAATRESEYREKYSLGQYKSKVTNILLVLNVAMFIIITIYGRVSGISYNELLGPFGKKINYNILNGEVWRLITCMFLHVSFIHILINGLSLKNMGSLVETIYGSKKFIIIYFVSGLIGSLASFAFSPVSAAGASGAIFGLVGAMLYFGLEEPDKSKKLFGSSIITMIIVNILYGVSVANIDNYAHIGGLLGGFAVSGLVSNNTTNKSYQPKWYLNRGLYAVIVILLIGGTTYIGINGPTNIVAKSDVVLETLEKEFNWQELELEANKLLETDINEKYKANAYWKVIQANIMLEDYDKAWSYIEDFSKIEKDHSNYLAGIIKYYTGEFEESRKYLESCISNNFKVEACKDILDDIVYK